MLGRRLLPCGRCGAWATEGGLCAGCGAVTAPERVSLDRAAADGRWIHSFRGSPEAISASLSGVVPVGEADARARIAAAGRVVMGVGQGPVSLTLDLRDGEAGAVSRTKRRGSAADTFTVLPWLLVRTAEVELRVVRHVHRKVRRSFAVDRVSTNANVFRLDEVWWRGAGGVIRRVVAGPGAIKVGELRAASGDAPGFERPLPATAPRPGSAGGMALASGVAAAVALLLVSPAILGWWATPAPGALSNSLESPRLSAAHTRRVMDRTDVWSLRKGLVAAADSVPPFERLRLFQHVAFDASKPLTVRLQAARLLEDEGALGASALVALEGRLAGRQAELDAQLSAAKRQPGARAASLQQDLLIARADVVDLRLAAIRALATRRDPRAAEIAQRGLERGGVGSTRRLRLGWILALSEATPSRAGERAAQIALGDPHLPIASQAAWIVAQAYPRSVPLIPLAFRRACVASQRGRGDAASLLSLARAMALSGQTDEAQDALAGLTAGDRAAVERVFREVGP